MSLLKKYVCVIQHDSKDCGVACLATITKQYGYKVPISTIREHAGTDNNGTTVYGLIKAAEKLKLKTKAVRIENFEEISEYFPKPAIAHVVMNESYMHYVVIHEVRNNKIIIADPAKGIVTYTKEEFFKIWTGVIIFLAPTQLFEKGDEIKGSFSRFFKVVLFQKSLIANIVIATILTTILGIGGAFYFKVLIDSILPNQLASSLTIVSIGMIGLAIFQLITDFIRSKLLVHMSQNMDISILLGYYKHVIELPMNFFGTRKVGEIISRFNDASSIREALSSATLTVLIDIAMAIGGGVILYNQSSKLFVMCFIPLVLYLILVAVFKKPLENGNKKYMEDNSQLTSYLIESLQGMETVKSFNAERKVNEETEKRFVKFINSIFKYTYIMNFQASLKAGVKSVFGIIIIWVGGVLILRGEISIGVLISFNALLVYFIGPIERLINLQPQLQKAFVAADRLSEIMDLDREKNDNEDSKISPENFKGDITFKNVDFRYGARKKVLNNINIVIKAGQNVAFVGESGSGKTTIAKLIMNFYDVESGEININSYNIKDINKDILREKISYISQDSFFFSGTIKENLLFAKHNATYENIVQSCKFAQIHDHINELPLRYETLLEENASNLSGGQRQRLAIARALLREPEILVMDEATSNLDSITEKAIERTIEKCTENVTTVIIAHRLSTIMKCDKIYVLKKGEIIEYGNHFDLMKNRGYYYNLWSQQSPDEYKVR